MVLSIDFSKYRVVDLSMEVIPNDPKNGDRPFDIRPGRLPDGTIKHDIINTHTHVGTHIEFPIHFYETGKCVTDYPLETFMGPAALLRAAPAAGDDRVRVEQCKEQLEPLRGEFEILFVRREVDLHPLRYDIQCVDYFAELGIKLFFFDKDIEFGEGLEDGKRFHDVLMSRDIPLGELPAGAAEVDKELFYLVGTPLKIRGLEAAPCRLFAIVER